ncbi:hypothetical protein SDC9_194975 [bioreactor metagenome]|uniref:Uncharacterized protein n=1 Tax=bioreactor metagenome TaxID=1076179 RepID=A0A645IJ63_9ZZZZ
MHQTGIFPPAQNRIRLSQLHLVVDAKGLLKISGKEAFHFLAFLSQIRNGIRQIIFPLGIFVLQGLKGFFQSGTPKKIGPGIDFRNSLFREGRVFFLNDLLDPTDSIPDNTPITGGVVHLSG